MSEMILKMSLITGMMCLLNVVLCRVTRNRKLNLIERLMIGVVFGLAAVMSTHFGIDYQSMVLNVRDIAPLSAGLFFGPAAGITAGIIGGAERFIVGTFFDVGAYTAIACSVSTFLAGIISAAFHKYLFKGRKPSIYYAFFIGSVTEVFHMFAVFLTHREDINTAFKVVDTCAIPMIVFTGIGMCVSSLLLSIVTGNRRSLFSYDRTEMSITVRFQAWLFVFIVALTLSTFFFFFGIQTRQAEQTAESELNTNIKEVSNALSQLDEQKTSSEEFSKQHGLNMCRAVAREIEIKSGSSIGTVTSAQLVELKNYYELYEINVINKRGIIIASSDPDNNGFDMSSGEQSAAFMVLLDGQTEELTQDYMPRSADGKTKVMYCAVAAEGGFVQVGMDEEALTPYTRLLGTAEELADRRIGEKGMIYIADVNGKILAGELKGSSLSSYGCYRENGDHFDSDITGSDSFCISYVSDNYRIVAAMPYSEVYLARNISAYETAFADILLFTLVFVLMYILVQRIIVSNLDSINKSLEKITSGNLNEVVEVSNSAEFISLSRDINATVSTLKRYIAEAEARINEELEFARIIQSSSLPRSFDFPSRDDFIVHACMDPAKEVGGDFYDLFFVDNDHLVLVMADVSGKGIPAAMFMMRSKATLKGFAEAGLDPAEVFTRTNEMLCEGNEKQMFVTAWMGKIDLTTGIMKCVSAGHEYPAIRRAGGDYELFKDKHGLVLGAMDGFRYKQYEIAFEPGDRIFQYTDGVAEANNEQGKLFGSDRMIEALNGNRDVSVRETLDEVMLAIVQFAGKADQFDDITMMCFEYKGKEQAGENPSTEPAPKEEKQ